MTESHRADFHQRLLDRYGPRGEALYLLVAGFLAIPFNGFAAYLIGQSLLFPSLSPTVFTFFRQPLTRQAAPRNAVLGHIIAAAVGLVALLAFGLYDHRACSKRG